MCENLSDLAYYKPLITRLFQALDPFLYLVFTSWCSSYREALVGRGGGRGAGGHPQALGFRGTELGFQLSSHTGPLRCTSSWINYSIKSEFLTTLPCPNLPEHTFGSLGRKVYQPGPSRESEPTGYR